MLTRSLRDEPPQPAALIEHIEDVVDHVVFQAAGKGTARRRVARLERVEFRQVAEGSDLVRRHADLNVQIGRARRDRVQLLRPGAWSTLRRDRCWIARPLEPVT